MMSLMIKENGVTFKELEKNIYAWVCQIGREFTKEFLERYYLDADGGQGQKEVPE